MPPASFGPEVVVEEAPEDVERLSSVGEPARVVTMDVQGIILFLKHSLAKENEGPGDGEVVGRLPFFPDVKEGFPHQLSGRAVQEAMLGGFRAALIAAFVESLDSHLLKPSAHQQSIVEGKPNEHPYFARTGVMPHPRNDLGDCGVAQV